VAADAGDSLTPLGQGPTMQVTMPNVTASQLGTPDFTGGVYLPVVLRVRSEMEEITAVYRLRYSLQFPGFRMPLFPNHNPQLDQIEIAYPDDAGTETLGSVAIHNGDQLTMRATFVDGSAETFPQIEGAFHLPDGGLSLDGGIHFFDGGVEVGSTEIPIVTETLRVSWFTNIGSLNPDVTGPEKPDTTLKLDKKHTPSPPADIDLYVVVRDDRGGTDFTQRKLLLR
jgi:hypothetical protein